MKPPPPHQCYHHARAGLDGLCPTCEADRAADPEAWAEFGGVEGEARWHALRREMAESVIGE